MSLAMKTIPPFYTCMNTYVPGHLNACYLTQYYTYGHYPLLIEGPKPATRGG